MNELSWFDGHLDLAYLQQQGRDMGRPAEQATGNLLPAAVTFPSLHAGNVRAALATIFIQREIQPAEAKRRRVEPEVGAWCYHSPADAARAAEEQLEIYARWEAAGAIRIVRDAGVSFEGGRVEPGMPGAPLAVALLLEGAAGVKSPEHFQHFYDAGVRVVSLTWNEGSQYAGGDQSGGDVTPLGRELLKELDRRRVIHDVSHLSERAFWTVMNETAGTKIASHSNARALLPGKQHPERHLSDAQIKALAQRPDAAIGIVLFSKFLVCAPAPAIPPRAAIADVLRHIRHIEQTAGRRDILALGSDMDGGFSQNDLPSDLTTPSHLSRLADALSRAGWTDGQIQHFAWNNWANVLAPSNCRSLR